MCNSCSHETFIHVSPQDPLLYLPLPPISAPAADPGGLTPGLLRTHRRALLLAGASALRPCLPAAGYRHSVLAPSIFRASCYGRWAVTHSLADSDFHGHRPAVLSNQRLSWSPMKSGLGALTWRLIHPRASVLVHKNWPTWHNHSSERSRSLYLLLAALFRQAGDLTHLNFENRLGRFSLKASNHSLCQRRLSH